MPKVNYSMFHGVEATRWDTAYMTANVNGLTVLGFDDLKIVDVRSGILLDGLSVGGNRGSAHINLTLHDGIEYLHLTIFDQSKTNLAKAAIYYKISTWGASITLESVTKTMIDGKLKNCTNNAHPDSGAIKLDLQKIVSVLFAGCKDT